MSKPLPECSQAESENPLLPKRLKYSSLRSVEAGAWRLTGP